MPVSTKLNKPTAPSRLLQGQSANLAAAAVEQATVGSVAEMRSEWAEAAAEGAGLAVAAAGLAAEEEHMSAYDP